MDIIFILVMIISLGIILWSGGTKDITKLDIDYRKIYNNILTDEYLKLNEASGIFSLKDMEIGLDERLNELKKAKFYKHIDDDARYMHIKRDFPNIKKKEDIDKLDLLLLLKENIAYEKFKQRFRIGYSIVIILAISSGLVINIPELMESNIISNFVKVLLGITILIMFMPRLKRKFIDRDIEAIEEFTNYYKENI